jgi:hypothetical protein
MSNPGLETSGPYARIAVEYVLGVEAEDQFKFSTDTETASRVTVDPNGAITIHWQEDDPQAQLDFTLISSPDNSFFNGFLLGWQDPDMPNEVPQPISYSVEAPPTEGGKAFLRTLVVKLDRGQGTYNYLLGVAHPTKNGTADPKIYNEGDGGGGGGHR